MFLASGISSERSEGLWSNLARIGIGLIVVFSLLIDPLAIPTRPGTLIINGLFLAWGLGIVLAQKFWRRSTLISRSVAFIDLIFSSAVVVFCHGFSLVWLPALFLLPTLELSSLYGIAGIAFVLIAFIWTVVLSGLMNLALFQQPLWWIVSLLWGTFILFTATLQAMRQGYMRPDSFRLLLASEQSEDQQLLSGKQESVEASVVPFATLIPQMVTAFELPFRHMGVHTEEHRHEIEAALNTLCNFEGNQEALSLCLERLLQAAKNNWIGLAAFSPREREILELLLQDCSYKEMGFRLHVSPSTIKTHIYHIFQKLDVSNRDEAMRLIHKRGWFASGQLGPLLLEVSSS